MKSNTASVTTDLGGGTHGHLGLVLTPAEYTVVSAVPYVRLAHPGNGIIPPGTAQHEATHLQSNHQAAIRLFRETVDVKKALIKQLVAAIESKYLKRLCNVNSNAIDIDLHAILTHLFERYGSVDEDNLMDVEEKVKTLDYNPSDPLVSVYNDVEELARLGTAANNPYSDMQKVQIGLCIVKNTNFYAPTQK